MQKAMSHPKVAILYGNTAIPDLVKAQLPGADITVFPSGFSDPSEEDIKVLKEAEIIFGWPRSLEKILSHCKNLKWIQTGSAGVDRVLKVLKDFSEEQRRELIISRNGETFARPMSEYVMGQILAVSLCFYHWRDQQRERAYTRTRLNSKPVSASAVGILGLGCIGKEVARKCKFFGMKVWALTRSEVPDEKKSPDVDEYRTMSGLSELLSASDYVVNLLPSTPETRGLLAGERLSHCRKATFINLGRGDVTDEASLLRALREGWLQHAVLDVHNPEPLPEDSALWEEPGVIITPHTAGGMIVYPDHVDDRADMFVSQYRRYMNKEPLKYLVDVQSGY